MAVYSNHSRHQPYQGRLTGPLERFMIIPRYAFRSLSESKIFLLLFTACFAVPLGCLLMIYLNHNLDAIKMLGIDPKDLNLIGNTFFLRITEIQCICSFFIMALVAPGLLLPDMNNNGLPLYFSRPITKQVTWRKTLCPGRDPVGHNLGCTQPAFLLPGRTGRRILDIRPRRYSLGHIFRIPGVDTDHFPDRPDCVINGPMEGRGRRPAPGSGVHRFRNGRGHQ